MARFLEPGDEELTNHTKRTWIGTLRYMSPEQVGAEFGEVEASSDVYSLGVLGFEMLTGHTPYEVDTKECFIVTRFTNKVAVRQ